MAMVLGLHELDPRHLGAITLAVPGLENACVAAGPSRELWSDLLKQLVRRATFVDVANGEATGVQRPRLRLADQLLDERPQFLGLGFGRLDRAVLDERRREISEQRETLLARSAKLPPRLLVPH